MLWAMVHCQNSTGFPLPSFRDGEGLCMCPFCRCSPCAVDSSTAAVLLECRICRLDVCPSLDGDLQLICSGAMSCERLTAIRVSTRQYLSLKGSNSLLFQITLFPYFPSTSRIIFHILTRKRGRGISEKSKIILLLILFHPLKTGWFS